jgi:REP element-mobilizing transposase RayT
MIKEPKEVAKLRILDPACGSGSFLIGAYQHLLDWHLNWYTQEAGVGARGVAPAGAKAARRVRRSAPKHPIYQTTGGQWRLTPAERKRILLNNIYGVDIDPQAVEVTKLSLLLKALEGETHDTLESELKLGIRALPDLGSNIKCGNSLIGPDFYDNAQMELLDDEEKYHINAFDWQSEFRQVFQADARHLWLVTFVTHNSRVSERMVTYGVEHGNALIFSKEEQLSIAKSVADTCKRYNIAVVAWNVLPDHIHMVIAAENEQVLIEHVRKIKGYSSHTYQKERKWESGQHVWAQKYHFKPISNDDALRAALQYVWNNRLKHQEQWGDDMLEVWGETEVFASLDFTLAPTLDPNKGLQPLDEFPSSPSTDKGLKPLVTTRGSSILDMLRDACVSVEEACCPRGGFDAVIGNPPWGSMLKPDEKRYLDSSYVSRTGEAESHLFFLEKGQALLAEGGLLSFITPNTWLAVVNSREIRRLLLRGSAFLEVMELSKYIFEQAPDIVPVIVLLQKTQASVGPCVVKRATFLRIHEGNFRTAFAVNNIDQNVWTDHLESAINIRATPVVRSLLAHCHARAVSLGSVAQVLYGIKTGDNSKYLSSAKTARHLKKALKTGELTRYSISWKGLYLWWNDKLAGYRKSSVEVPKIIVQYIRKLSLTRRIIAAVDASGEFYPLNNYSYITVNEEPYSLLYLAGIINSSLVNYYYANTFIDYNIKPTYLSQLPIRTINLSDKKDKAQHDKMVSLVERMLKLHKELPKAKTPDEKTRLERQITATDKQIDNLVYDLYGLTEEEIKIVEGE